MLNKVQIIGRLGQDPEVRYSPDGAAIANVSVATSETWKDKNTGERKERTEWHRVAVFGKLAEIVGEYLRKGALVYFEGSLQTRKWQDQQGQDRYTTEIRVDQVNGRMKMLDTRQQDGQQGQQQEQRPQGNQYAQQTRQEQRPAPQQQSVPDLDDDSIPF